MSQGRFGTGTIPRSAFSGSRMPLKIATWNVNSVRQRLAHLERFCGLYAPDVVCLQEIKVPSADFPAAAVAAFGYPYIEVHGQKGYNGVAILSRQPLQAPSKQKIGRASCRERGCQYV